MYPALHWQSLASLLPGGAPEFDGQLKQLDVTCATVVEYLCAPQFVHVPMPTPVLYVPALHATHAIPSLAAAYPALHEQMVASVLGLYENVFAGHSTQWLSA